LIDHQSIDETDMVLVVMVMMFYFKKKKWFKKNEGNEEIPDDRPVKQPREF
jgi:hypothetical protein